MEWGHAVGDLELQMFANMLQNKVAEKQTAARWGGKEFIIICPQTQLKHINELVRGLLHGCQVLEVPTDTGQHVKIKCSIGFTFMTDLLGQDNLRKQIEQAIELADKALYKAKEQARNQACGYLIKQVIDESTLKRYIADTEQLIDDQHIKVTAIN